MIYKQNNKLYHSDKVKTGRNFRYVFENRKLISKYFVHKFPSVLVILFSLLNWCLNIFAKTDLSKMKNYTDLYAIFGH